MNLKTPMNEYHFSVVQYRKVEHWKLHNDLCKIPIVIINRI
jgi:hypothetical protein